jgi:hypothetical protein
VAVSFSKRIYKYFKAIWEPLIMNWVTIKHYGRKAKCHSLESLHSTLTEQYANHSVTIINTLANGLNKTFFVTVRDDGTLVKTYDEQKDVSLNAFVF